MVIWELETVQSNVKQATHDTKEKLRTLTVQGVEEILGTKEGVTREVAKTKDTSKKFI
jgi:hypothetical protein